MENTRSSMRLAIMQPYLFPYIGYFQLIHAVDRFVVYDDVNFIKQGWVNRNRILIGNEPHLFTMPLIDAGSFTPINAIALGAGYANWRPKFLKTLTQVYRKAPHFEQAMHVVEQALHPERKHLSELLVASLRAVMDHVGISTELVSTSANYKNNDLAGQERVLDICRQEGASDYVNPIGGVELYSKAAFAERGIRLWFLRSALNAYPQFGTTFHPGLSIVDVMMFVQASDLKRMMADHTLE